MMTLDEPTGRFLEFKQPQPMMKSMNPVRKLAYFGIAVMLFGSSLVSAQDDSVEGLYRRAVEFNAAGDPVKASETFEKLFDLAKPDLLIEDYGAQAGGMFFDYAMTLIPQKRWDDAKEWLKLCVNAKAKSKELGSVIDNANPRESLGRFQLGFVEAQQGNHEEALRLYQVYMDSNPPAQELAQVRNSFFLRKGTSLIQLGKVDEGVATVQQLFDNREAWRVKPPFLMQGILELGMGWIGEAGRVGADQKALEALEVQAHAFLDQNLKYVTTEPFDSFRFGFVDRFRKLGYECTKVGLYSLGLRFFSNCPTLEEIREDVNLRLARLPIGAGVPGAYQEFINKIDEREKAPMHPDAETLRLIATCYERMGNLMIPRNIYWHLSETYPDLELEKKAEILHEASRFSAMIGDYSSAQYFGEKFIKETPEDHPLRDNVSTFMLQSLFTTRQYDTVIKVCESVRERYDLGDEKRELADALYPLALYSLKRNADAEKPFDEYVGAYKDSGNREMVVFHRASNSLINGKMREAAEQIEDFLKEFPKSEKFGDTALGDLATARYNLEDYSAAIAASDRLEEFKPDSIQMGRTLNIEGDSYLISADQFKAKEQAEQKEEFRKKGLEAYLGATIAGKAAMAKMPEQEEYFKNVAAEGIWKAADQYLTNENPEKVLEKYDEFFPEFAGTYWEPQISIFSLETLEQNGRAEEGLAQVEKMINQIGNKPPEEQDMDLLRKAIGSYSEASVRVRGAEETLKILDDFPGIDSSNQALLTWLKIQKVIVLQELRDEKEKDSPEYAAIVSRINGVFEEMSNFEKRDLSEYALQQIGNNFARGDNPFRAIPYYDELLARETPDADAFKSDAEFNIGLIEMRNSTKVASAKERFRRVINKYKDPDLIPDSHLNLAQIHIKGKEWDEALEHLQIINKQKKYFSKDKGKRAEAGLLLGEVAQAKGDSLGAAKAYLSVLSTYNAFPEFATEAFHRYAKISLADIKAAETGDAVKDAAKRERELALYKIYLKYIYMWQRLSPDDSPTGALVALRRELGIYKSELNIGIEDEASIRFGLGIPDDWNPETGE